MFSTVDRLCVDRKYWILINWPELEIYLSYTDFISFRSFSPSLLFPHLPLPRGSLPFLFSPSLTPFSSPLSFFSFSLSYFPPPLPSSSSSLHFPSPSFLFSFLHFNLSSCSVSPTHRCIKRNTAGWMQFSRISRVLVHGAHSSYETLLHISE